MNKGITFLVLTSLPLFIVGQITDIKVSDNLKLNRVYLGLDSKTGVEMSNFKRDNSVSLQTGILLTYSLTPHFSIRSHGAIKLEGNKPIEDFSAFEIAYDGLNRLSLHIGSMTTPTTELRPNPITWQSQTESNAQSNIIGGRPGVKIKYKINLDLKIIYGLYNHSGIWANHLKVNYKAVNIAGYIERDKVFFAVDYSTRKINSTLTFVPNDKFSNSIFVNLKKGYSPMAELEYSWDSNSMTYSNVGLRKYFTSDDKKLKGFLSISYNPLKDNQITGRYFIHI